MSSKNLLVMVLVVLLANGVSLFAAPLADNVWPDPNLETASGTTPNAPDGWARGGGDWGNDFQPYATFWDDTVSVSPTHSLKISDQDTGNAFSWFSANPPILQQAVTFTVRWNWKAENISGGDGGFIMHYQQENGAGNVLSSGSLKMASGTFDWTEETVTIPTVPGAERLRMSCETAWWLNGLYNMSATGTLWIDSISVAVMKCTTGVIGDVNNDCQLNFADFAIIASHWLECNRDPQTLCE